MSDQFSLKKLREISVRIGYDNNGPLYNFFRAIDDNEMDEHAALIILATQLAIRNEELVKINMRMAECLSFGENNES